MKFWLYFLAVFFLGVTVQMIRRHEVDFIAYAFSVLGAFIVSSAIILNQTQTRSRDAKQKKR